MKLISKNFKKIGTVLLLCYLTSCATMVKVAKVNEPEEDFMIGIKKVAIEPLNVTVTGTSMFVIQLGKEMESQNIGSTVVKNDVRVLVRSPRTLEDYSVKKQDYPNIARDGIADFFNSYDFDLNLYKGWSLKSISGFTKDVTNSINLSAPYDVVRLESTTDITDADIIIGGQIDLETTVVRVTGDFTDSPGANMSQDYPEGTYLLQSYINLILEVKDSNGKVLTTYSEPPYAISAMETNESVVVIPANTEEEVLSYMKSDQFAKLISSNIEKYMAIYTPLFKQYITHEYVKAEE